MRKNPNLKYEIVNGAMETLGWDFSFWKEAGTLGGDKGSMEALSSF